MKHRLEWIFIITILGVFSAFSVLAVPSGPSNYIPLGSSSFPELGSAEIPAIAGNVSEVNFESNVSTQTWQGYFGNISGSLTLGNANNKTLYNWALTVPGGQVYATRLVTVPTWTSIACANSAQITTEDGDLGVNQSSDQDSVIATFSNTTAFNAFYVGGVNIDPNSQTCFAAYLNGAAGAPSSSFTEVLLHDTAEVIYTALITPPTAGFDGAEHQFQMLVGENGHLADANPTTYYFYLELN